MVTNHLAVSLSSVCLDIRGTRILSDISWDVGRGEKWVVLGLNGSGKTSLLRLLSGFGYPSRGDMQVLGEHFGRADLHQMRKRIGWVHGDLAADFPGFMNCREVVMSGAEGSIALYETMPDGSRRARGRGSGRHWRRPPRRSGCSTRSPRVSAREC